MRPVLAQCPRCDEAVECLQEAPSVVTRHVGDPRHHCPPSDGTTAAFTGSCPCSGRVRLSYLGSFSYPAVPHAHDGSVKCPHCGENSALGDEAAMRRRVLP